MTPYAPRSGSVAAKAIEYLQVNGETATSPLADAIDAEAKNLLASVEYAIRNGAIAVRKRDGLNWYSVGNGQPIQRAADEEDDELPPLPARKGDTAVSLLRKVRQAAEPDAAVIAQEGIERARWTPPAEPEFACGLYSDGRFVVELGDKVIVLKREHTEALIRFVERLAPEDAA